MSTAANSLLAALSRVGFWRPARRMSRRSYGAFLSYSHAEDAVLAGKLQTALEQLGKPWYRRRNLNVFRDQTDLAISPELWPSIQAAMARSEYFVYLASPQASESKWVTRELRYWFEDLKRDTRHFLIAVTAGELLGDPDTQEFDWARSSVLPHAIRSILQGKTQPLWADFRVAKRDGKLSLSDSGFRSESVRLAAQIHGLRPKELDSDDLKQHRRTTRLAVSAVVLLALLAIAALIFGGYALVQRERAESNAQLAEERAREADVERARALSAQSFAEHQRVRARAAATGVAEDEKNALDAIAPKYLGQSKHHDGEAKRLQAALETWRQEHGTQTPVPNKTFSLEVFRAEMGTALLVHYGTPGSHRYLLIDGGPRQTYRDAIKPRLESLRQGDKPVPVTLVVATQTDIQQMQGLIDLFEDLQGQPPDRRSVVIGALWSNAFVPGPPESAAELVSNYPKGRLVAGARALLVPVNVPFTRMVAAPEAGAARVTLDDELRVTVLSPRVQWLRRFADHWLADWRKRVDTPQQLVALRDYDIVETFADSRIELLPSPIEITDPANARGGEASVVNLASTVLMLEVGGRRMLLPADARSDVILNALAQAGYTDEQGKMKVDVLVLPHGGSGNNVSADFFLRVKARHYVVSNNGTFGNPKLRTFEMLLASRRGDPDAFSIALTYPPEEYKDGYPVRELCALLARERDAGARFDIVTPKKEQRSFGIDLWSDAAWVDKGDRNAVCHS